MTSLIVRNLDEALVEALRARAITNGRSAEAEHREILSEALGRPQRRSFADVLAVMPNVGRDEDFERLSPNYAAWANTGDAQRKTRSRHGRSDSEPV